MKRRDLLLGDIFSLENDTYLVTYVGKYGLTAYSLTRRLESSISFSTDTYGKSHPILVTRGNFTSIQDVQNAYPEFFI